MKGSDMAKAGTGDESLVANLNDLAQMVEDGITSRTVFKRSYGQGILFCLAPKEELLEHTASHPATVHILRGEGLFEMEGKSFPARPAVLFHIPAHLPHAVHADAGGEGLVFLLTMHFVQN